MTKLTSRARAWSDRVLLTPVLSGLAKPFQLLWSAIAFVGLRIWRQPLGPIWRLLLRPALWLPARWIGLRTWRLLLRPALWLPARWIGLRIWRLLLRPIWSLSRWAGAMTLVSPRIVARAFPNRGWLTGSFVLAAVVAVLVAPGAINAKTRDRLSPVTTATAQTLGTVRPEISVSLAPFAGWGLEPADDQHRELVLKQAGDELRILRADHVPDAENFLRQYAHVKLGAHDRINLYPVPAAVKDANGRQVRVLQIEQSYRVATPARRSRTYQTMLYDYGATVLLLVLSTGGFEQKANGAGHSIEDQWRALQDSVRITP